MRTRQVNSRVLVLYDFSAAFFARVLLRLGKVLRAKNSKTPFAADAAAAAAAKMANSLSVHEDAGTARCHNNKSNYVVKFIL